MTAGISLRREIIHFRVPPSLLLRLSAHLSPFARFYCRREQEREGMRRREPFRANIPQGPNDSRRRAAPETMAIKFSERPRFTPTFRPIPPPRSFRAFFWPRELLYGRESLTLPVRHAPAGSTEACSLMSPD